MNWVFFQAVLMNPFLLIERSFLRPELVPGFLYKTIGCALGFVGLFSMGSLVCATGQGGTDGSADSSVKYEGGRRWSAGSLTGDASGHQMANYVLASGYPLPTKSCLMRALASP